MARVFLLSAVSRTPHCLLSCVSSGQLRAVPGKRGFGGEPHRFRGRQRIVRQSLRAHGAQGRREDSEGGKEVDGDKGHLVLDVHHAIRKGCSQEMCFPPWRPQVARTRTQPLFCDYLGSVCVWGARVLPCPTLLYS